MYWIIQSMLFSLQGKIRDFFVFHFRLKLTKGKADSWWWTHIYRSRRCSCEPIFWRNTNIHRSRILHSASHRTCLHTPGCILYKNLKCKFLEVWKAQTQSQICAQIIELVTQWYLMYKFPHIIYSSSVYEGLIFLSKVHVSFLSLKLSQISKISATRSETINTFISTNDKASTSTSNLGTFCAAPKGWKVKKKLKEKVDTNSNQAGHWNW